MRTSFKNFLPLAVLVAATFASMATCYYVTIVRGEVPLVELEVRE